MSNVPQRFTEAAFRRYEACIASVLTNWPEPTVFNPSLIPLSNETFTCRFRDAVTAVLRYSYPCNKFSREALYEIQSAMSVSQRDGKVVVGPRSVLRLTGSVSPIHCCETGPEDDTYVVKCPSSATFDAFCRLLSERLLDKPLRVEVLDPQLLLQMQEKYDIDATLQDDGSTIII